MNKRDMLLSELAGAVWVDAYILMELPEVVSGIKEGKSLEELVDIVNELI